MGPGKQKRRHHMHFPDGAVDLEVHPQTNTPAAVALSRQVTFKSCLEHQSAVDTATGDPFLINSTTRCQAGMLSFTVRPSVVGVEFPEPDLCYAFSQDGTRLITYDNGYFRLFRTSDFLEICRTDADVAQKVVNLSFVSDSNSSFFVFFNGLSSARFSVQEYVLTSDLAIIEDEGYDTDDESQTINNMKHKLAADVDRISSETELSSIAHCAENREDEIVVIITSGRKKVCKIISSFGIFGAPFKYSHAFYCRGRLLMIGRGEVHNKEVAKIAYWSNIQQYPELGTFSSLKGSNGKFAGDGLYVITWDGCASGLPDGGRCVQVYETRSLSSSSRVKQSTNPRGSNPNRHLHRKPKWTYTTPDASVVLHADISPPEGADRSALFVPGSKLVLLCDMCWSDAARIFVIDVQTKAIDFQTETSITFKEDMEMPFRLMRQLYDRRPFTISPDNKWLFLFDGSGETGTLHSLKTEHPLFQLDWTDEKGFIPKRMAFDSTGTYINLDDGTKMMLFSVATSWKSSKAADLKYVLSHATLSAIEHLRQYDRGSIGNLIAHGFAFECQLRTQLMSFLEQDTLPNIQHKINSFGKGSVAQVVLSEDSTLVAFVIQSDPVRIEFWKVDQLKDEMHLLSEPWKSVLLPDASFEDTVGDSIGMFCKPKSDEEALTFAFVNPRRDGVSITRVNLTNADASNVNMIRPRGQGAIKVMKVTEDGSRALIIFSTGRFIVIRLKDSFGSELTARFRYPCDLNVFLKCFIDNSFIHISEDCKKLVVGWGSANKTLLSFSLEASERGMRAEYKKNYGLLMASGYSYLPWINKGHTRAIVHSGDPGPLCLIFYDTSGSRGKELMRLSTSIPRMDKKFSPDSDVEWIDTFDPDNADDIGVLCCYALAEIQELTPDSQLLNLLGVELDETKTRELISKFAANVINAESPDEVSLVHHAIMHGQFSCAKMLFDFAAAQNVSVSLSWGCKDILGWAIDRELHETVDFVLQMMSNKCTTVTETARLIRKYFDALLNAFPHLLENHLTNDSFCFEFGRFQVPLSVFKGRGGNPIAMTCDHIPSWEAASSDEAKALWMAHNKELANQMEDASGIQVVAISKFVCIEGCILRKPFNMISQLVAADYPSDIFKTDTVKLLVHWTWHRFLKRPFLFTFLLHVCAAFLFSLFAANFGMIHGDGSDRNGAAPTVRHDIVRLSIFGSVFLQILLISESMGRITRVFSAGIVLTLLVYCLDNEKHSEFTAFITSCECLFFWTSILFYLQPFKATGTLTSMIRYMIRDIRLFLMLVLLLMVSFGLAFRVLFDAPFITGSVDGQAEEEYSSIVRSFQSTYFAFLGNFDVDIFYGGTTTFISMWRGLLFNLFMFLAGAVLLSLLIAILGDTYDKVKLTEVGEVIKSRARIVGDWDGWFGIVSRQIRKEKKYLHFLVPAEKVVAQGSAWDGKILELVKAFKTTTTEIEQRSFRSRDELKTEMEEMKELLLAQSGNQNEQLVAQGEDMQDRISKIEHALDQLLQRLN